MAKSTNKKKRIAVVLLLLAVGGTFYYVKRAVPEDQGGVYHGNVDIRDVTLAFRAGGRVHDVLKTEGDQVAQGETIARLDKEPFELVLKQVQAAAEVADAQLQNVEAGARREDISQARAVLQERKAVFSRAQDTFERVSKLEATGAATTQALVDAKAAVEQSRAAVTASEAAVTKLVNGARSEELHVAHAQAQQAQSAVAIAELNLRDAELKSPTAGVVVTRVIEPGTMVQPGSPALVIAFDNPVWIRAYASERDLAAVAPGAKVQVYTDSRPDQPYEGQVGYVSPQAEFTPKNVETEELRTSLVYRFRVVVEKHDGGLRQGMPVTVVPKKGS
jgi:HlyD family secretion protein